MKKIQDIKQIDYWIERDKIRNNFDTPDLVFHAYHYEKGEYITTPGKQMDEILFLVEGTILIYGVHDDGSLSPINQLVSPALLGDLEFSDQGVAPFFTETKTEAVCLSLSTKKYYKQLNSDLSFLHTLLQSYSDKLKIFSFVDTVTATLEERVLLYMKSICPQQEINGIEKAIFQLRCSRRQLQRVLKKLCDNREIEKIGKGKYKLIT